MLFLSRIGEQILPLKGRQQHRNHFRDLGRRISPLPPCLRGPLRTQRFQFGPQRREHFFATHHSEEFVARSQASTEWSGAIAVKQPSGIREPARFTSLRIAGVGLQKEMEAKAVGLTDHRQAVMGTASGQREHLPAGTRPG